MVEKPRRSVCACMCGRKGAGAREKDLSRWRRSCWLKTDQQPRSSRWRISPGSFFQKVAEVLELPAQAANNAPGVGGAAAGSSSRRAGPARPRGSVGRAAQHDEEEVDSYTSSCTYSEDERPAVGRAAAPVKLTPAVGGESYSESDSSAPWRRLRRSPSFALNSCLMRSGRQ